VRILALDIELTGSVHMWWFLNSTEFDFKELSPNHSQDKSSSCLGLNKFSD